MRLDFEPLGVQFFLLIEVDLRPLGTDFGPFKSILGHLQCFLPLKVKFN